MLKMSNKEWLTKMAKDEDNGPISAGVFPIENGFKVLDFGWESGTGMPYELIFIYTDDGEKYLFKGMSPTLDRVIGSLFYSQRIVYNTTMWMNGKCRSSSWGSNCPIYFFEKNTLPGHKKIEIMIFPEDRQKAPNIIQVRRVPRRWLKDYNVATTKEPLF